MAITEQQETDTLVALSAEEFTSLAPEDQRDYISGLMAREAAERGWEVESC